MAESDSKIQDAVFIIESPGPWDVLEGREEGGALSAALNLAKIPNHHYLAYNVNAFKVVFQEKIPPLATYDSKQEKKIVYSPIIHISAHGNEHELVLTSGESLSWNQIAHLLIDLAEQTGHTREGVSNLRVCFSTCLGAYAQEMLSFGRPYPCYGIVGPLQSVSWSDSLTAYITFYHQMIAKQNTAIESVRIMNVAAGLPKIFHVFKIPE